MFIIPLQAWSKSTEADEATDVTKSICNYFLKRSPHHNLQVQSKLWVLELHLLQIMDGHFSFLVCEFKQTL